MLLTLAALRYRNSDLRYSDDDTRITLSLSGPWQHCPTQP